MTGAPGSKWSGVARSLYTSYSVDTSDASDMREYSQIENGLSHQGAYWDPGMEFGIWDWDGPFSGEGTRIVKSHTMAHYMQELVDGLFGKWTHPIVMVMRNDYECMKWWKQAGGWDITYPNYSFYQDDDAMFEHIQNQNKATTKFLWDNRDSIKQVKTNYDAARACGLDTMGLGPRYAYQKDVNIYVYQPKSA